jgi:ATP-dependent DNA helicase RecG
MIQLHRSLDTIKGVGEKTAGLFSKAGLHTINDLLYFYPKSYDDFSNITTVDALKPGKVTLKTQIHNITTRRVRRGMHITSAVLSDETGSVRATWFNQPYRADHLRDARTKKWLVSGEYNLSGNVYQLTNPSVEAADGRHVTTGRISPNYRAMAGLKSQMVRKILLELKPLLTMLPETLPKEIVARQGLISHSQALLNLHFPNDAEDITLARERLGFEELKNEQSQN